MKKTMLALLAITSLFGGASLFAQTGPSSLSAIRDEFKDRSEYRIEEGEHHLVFRDATSGAEVFTLSESSTGGLTLSGRVRDMKGSPTIAANALDEKIAGFNYSSAVGTMWVDQRTGQVTMLHHLNPYLVSQSGLVNVADRFGEAIRTETRMLGQ